MRVEGHRGVLFTPPAHATPLRPATTPPCYYYLVCAVLTSPPPTRPLPPPPQKKPTHLRHLPTYHLPTYHLPHTICRDHTLTIGLLDMSYVHIHTWTPTHTCHVLRSYSLTIGLLVMRSLRCHRQVAACCARLGVHDVDGALRALSVIRGI